MSSGRHIAEFADYAGMLDAVRARVNELQINGERFDEFAGLPRGYLSKLIGARPVKRISMLSMGILFNALGIYCIMVEDPNATARLKSRIRPNNTSFRRITYPSRIVTNRTWRQIQKLGWAANRRKFRKMKKAERSAVMRAVRMGVKSR